MTQKVYMCCFVNAEKVLVMLKSFQNYRIIKMSEDKRKAEFSMFLLKANLIFDLS